jgi:ATPase subunit of ABC transporter with duplicated ATPase domains
MLYYVIETIFINEKKRYDMISANNITLRVGKKALFEDVNIKFTEGNCYGLIGANGAGKSTFLKILSGQLEPTKGDIVITPGQRLSFLQQDHFKYDAYPVLDTVIMGNERLYQIMKEKEAIYAKEDFTDEDGIRASELEGEFAEMNGWEAESDAATLLNGLGVDTEFHYTQMADLTGSMKVKVLLAQALFGNPDILLLDEPTNHLELPAIEWLEEFLINFDNTVIVVSHDRYFLNKVCTHTADIDYGKIQLYAGNYDFWFESSQLLIKQMKEANKKKEEKIKELQEFISRFSANASKSKQATSRKRALEKIQLDDMRPSSRKYPYIDFRPNREIGNEVLMVENLSKTIDGVKVLDNISFTLGREDKVAFVGANEQAITTFFKILTGEMEPDEGNYKWGVTTSQAYFPKDNTQEFDNDLTITDWLTQYSEIKDSTYVRGFLGRMLFPGEDGVKRVRVLSGGEKVRCLLSKMMISGANILILDEPTNHLDMESITALNNGLIKFPGVILFTSHDHQFVQTTANRIMEILPNGKLVDKITTYDEYLASDEMAKKRHVFQVNEEDAQDN